MLGWFADDVTAVESRDSPNHDFESLANHELTHLGVAIVL